MIIECERCHQEVECEFAGRPADIEEDKVQNGEWLCRGCQQLRLMELDEAINKLRDFLK